MYFTLKFECNFIILIKLKYVKFNFSLLYISQNIDEIYAGTFCTASNQDSSANHK